MNRLFVGLVLTLAAGLSFGQDAPPAPSGVRSTKVKHFGSFPAVVTKTLDSSKLKAGDAVEVKTAGSFKLYDGTMVPKHSKLIGQVTLAKAVSNSDPESQLALVFEKLEIKDGKQLAIKGIVQAVFPPMDELDPRYTNGPMAKESGIGLSGDVRSGSNLDAAGHAQQLASPSAEGVQGIKNLELDKMGMLTSKGKSVKLGIDVRLIVKAEIKD